MAIRSLILVFTMSAPLSSLAGGQTPPIQVTPFRSDLWHMEFQTEKGPAAETGTGVESGQSAKRRPSDSTESPLIDAPGQLELSDLTMETPLADWQVDESAAPLTEKVDEPVSAWQLSQASGFAGPTTQNLANGPSAVTFAVAIVAGIVLTGALFSGRE